MKAFLVVVALVASFGSASANGPALGGRGVEVAPTQPSHLHHVDGFEAKTPSKQPSFEDIEVPLVTAGADTDAGSVDSATAQISDTLKAKIRAIVAFMRDEASNSADGELIASRIRVRCAVKKVVSKKKNPSLAAMPALMLSERAAGAPEPTSTASVEACTLKLLQVRRGTVADADAGTGEQSFSFELPPLDETAP